MNSTIIWLTAGIFAATVAQAAIAYLLWKLNRNSEAARTRTFVGAGMEIRRPEPSQATRAYLRIGNASGVGVMVKRVDLSVSINGQLSELHTRNLNFVIGPYGSVEMDVSELIRDAVKANPSKPKWDGPHSARLDFVTHYQTGEKTHTGYPLNCQVEFEGIGFARVEYAEQGPGNV